MSTPQKLGKYEIQRKLGQGGMGVVYVGYDPEIERPVALKTIRLDTQDTLDRSQSGSDDRTVKDDLLLRLRREAQAAGRLQHPNIVSVYELGQATQKAEDGTEVGLAFIAMEFVDGSDLGRQLAAGKRHTLAEIKPIMGQLLDALAYSHSQGVVHRDIKPANVLVMADGRVKVADFGIARIASSKQALTQTGMALGTMTHMAPEQFKGQAVDGRADIYAAGVVLYELLTGQLPFDAPDITVLLHRVLHERASPPSASNPEIPRAFDAVLERALAKKPEDRFQTAAEMKQALFAAADGRSPASDGQKLGKYDIVRRLGKGGMGVVYEGYDPQIQRPVALKVIRLDARGPVDPMYMQRFKREAQAAGRLQHPNIVSVYEFVEALPSAEDGSEISPAFIVMEFVEGTDLARMLDEGKRYSIAEIAHLMGQVLDALDYSHAQGVVHRDIKPANLLLMTDDKVKVVDFGIARIASSKLTQVGSGMGTPAYMAPEQINKAETVDERADIYAAGVVLYELLTGAVPFDGKDTARVLSEHPAPPSTRRPGIPQAFDVVVERALAKQPADRFQSALEFKQAIQAAAKGHQVPDGAATDSLFARPWVRWASVAALALAVIGGGGYAAYSLIEGDGLLDDTLIPVVTQNDEQPAAPEVFTPAPASDAAPNGADIASAAASLPVGTLKISAVGLIEEPRGRIDTDELQLQDLARANARRQLMTKAAALYVEPDSLRQHDAIVGERLMARTGELIKTVLNEGQLKDRDGRPLMDLEAAVKVREVQKLLNEISKQERIELVRNRGNAKIAVVVRSSESNDSGEPQRSIQAENILKAQLQSYGFSIFSNDVADSSIDFRVESEVKFKRLSATLQPANITIEKFALTSWTVRAIDVKTKEEIYLNTEIPVKKSWATEEQALQEVGKLLAAAFPRNFFLQYYDFKPQRIQWQFRGVPEGMTTALLFEMKGMVQVLDAVVAEQGAGSAVIETAMSGMGDAGSGVIAETVLRPLNRKVGERCFGYAGADAARIRITIEPSCADGKALSRLASPAIPTVS